MFHRHVGLYLHFIWSTWDRVPWMELALQPRLHAVVASVARDRGCSFVQVGGVSEHVHVLVRAPPTVPASELVRDLKGVSSRFAHVELGVDPALRWSGGYALFSVQPAGVEGAAAYVRDQARHHEMGTTDPAYELPD